MPSVTRRMRDLNTGSVVQLPAGPSTGSTGLACGSRSMIAWDGPTLTIPSGSSVIEMGGGGGGGGGSTRVSDEELSAALLIDDPDDMSVTARVRGAVGSALLV